MAKTSHVAERFKPSICERLKQSGEDKKLKGARKPQLVKKKEPTPMPVPIFATLQNNTNTPTLTANLQVARTTARGSETVWVRWSTTTSCNTGSTLDIWDEWNTGSMLTTGSTVWSMWNEYGQRSRLLRPDPRPLQRPAIQVLETEEDRRRRNEQEQRFRREEEEKQSKVRAAYERAMTLLKSCLNSEQKDSLEKSRFFYVTAPSGRRYRIDEGTHGNLKVVDKDGRVIERLCVQPNGVPAGDAMLVQKLMIETAEDALRSHANITLKDGRILYGNPALLDNQKLAEVIPLRRAG